MKKLFLICLTFVLFAGLVSANEAFKLNDTKVDAMFNSATETSAAVSDMSVMNSAIAAPNAEMADNTTTVLVAWVVDWFVGGFGIHRYVLGTKGSMWAIYTFTVCGIFGIVPFVDFWVLGIDGLIMGHGDKYMNNNKFFMWGGK